VIAPFAQVLGEPGCGRAVGAFTAYDLETARAIVRAAESRESPVILLLSRAAFAGEGGPALLAAMLALGEAAAVPVCVQLDHVADLELVARAAELGCGAAMADGSRLAFEQNVALVAEARRLLEPAGAEVEAELGHLAGGEDRARAVAAGGLTDPAQVQTFLERTGASCLAVSIGNVHGTYAEPPRLEWDLLAQIRERAAAHLSLHGASGLADADLARAIELGVTKVNVNLELRQAYFGATERALGPAAEGFDLLELHDAQATAVRAVVAAKIDVLGGRG
jgi:ketose-bisphosphate aldolase